MRSVRGTRGATGALCLLAVAVPFLSSATAQADRDPRKGERAAVERAVRHGNAESGVARVTVSDVRISTVDPHWARVVYSIYFPRSGVRQDVESIYRRANGRGWNAPVKQIPAPVEDDLGWSDSDTVEEVARIATFVVMGIVALVILGVLARLGGGGSSPGPGPAGPSPPVGGPVQQPAGEKTCPICWGSRSFPCQRCHGRCTEPNPHPPPADIMCGLCFGRGSRDCERCHGTGQVPA